MRVGASDPAALAEWLVAEYGRPVDRWATAALLESGGLREQPENDYLQHSDPATWPRWIVLTPPISRRSSTVPLPAPVRLSSTRRT